MASRIETGLAFQLVTLFLARHFDPVEFDTDEGVTGTVAIDT